MSTKAYYLRFGSGNPATYTGLSPTFIVFRNASGSTTAPSITELGSTGVYKFDYECTGSVAFVADGATTGLVSADRYVAGALDITDRLDQFIGATTDGIGDSSTDPTTLYGFLKRVENYLEGQSIYTKSSGVLQSYDKTGATLLVSRTISDAGSTVTKT